MLQTWRERIKGLRKWRLLSMIIMVALALGVMGYLIYRERDLLLSYPWKIQPLPLLAAFFLFLFTLGLASMVWTWIVSSLGVKIGFWRNINYYFISYMARRLPGTLWYVAYLAQAYKGEGFSAWLTSMASGLELVVSVISGIVVSLLFAEDVLSSYPLGQAGVAILTAACLAFLHPRPLRWLLRRFGSSAEPPPAGRILKWVGLYIVIRILSGWIVYIAINAIYPLPLDKLAFIIGVWSLVGVLSTLVLFSISNFGVTEVSLSLLLSAVIPSSVAVVAAVGLRILFTLFEVIDALLVMGLNAFLRKSDVQSIKKDQ